MVELDPALLFHMLFVIEMILLEYIFHGIVKDQETLIMYASPQNTFWNAFCNVEISISAKCVYWILIKVKSQSVLIQAFW